jgi:DNA (cytosine-5)-methyltransferase 1
MRLLDLFCGAGGCSVGYHRAGFADIVGVDNRPMPRYPFEFVQGDAVQALQCMIEFNGTWNGWRLTDFDAIHASPPCQSYSDLSAFAGKDHPRLVEPIREQLQRQGRPWVIENVEGAPLIRPIILCGSMFGLGAWCNDGKYHQLRRHRLFETSTFFLVQPCRHIGKPVGVYGNGGGNKARVDAGLVNGMTGTASERREAMGIDWMTRDELSQAIPPAYTEFIGRQLLDRIEAR